MNLRSALTSDGVSRYLAVRMPVRNRDSSGSSPWLVLDRYEGVCYKANCH